MKKIGVSAGSACVLGLKHIASDVAPTTAYLIVGDKCQKDCAFCSKARTATSRADNLSRITWPEFEAEDVLPRVVDAYEKGQIFRTCFQATTSAGYLDELVGLVQQVGDKMPICVSVIPRDMSDIKRLIDAGAARVGLSLDAACERVYHEIKGGSWDKTLEMLRQAVGLYPGRITTHLIAGLGETEQEFAAAVQMLTDMGVKVAVFAFTPVRGTKMEKNSPPPIESYRRLQTAYYLIVHNLSRAGRFTFDAAGSITGFGIPANEISSQLSDGEAFRTSGCEGCNRPYYNERPGMVMYNYPRPLTPAEAQQALDEALHGVD